MKRTSTAYSFFSKKEYNLLTEKQDAKCISIYIPTHRAGKEVDEEQGKLTLKNCLQDIATQLSQYSYNEADIEELLRPAKSLLNDLHFWRNQSDGLAIFLNNDEMEYYTLPLHFQTYTYISNHFYLKPLIPFFNGDGNFYLLKLSQGEVRLFEANRYTITEIFINDHIPESITGLAEQDSQQINSHLTRGLDDKEIVKFFRAIDKGLMNLIHDKSSPLILACQGHYFPIYKDITNYTNLYDEFISGNPEYEDPILLHEKAWLLLKNYFQHYRKDKVKQLQDILNSGKASSNIEEIICAAVEGRVDTLFIDSTKEIFGLYDKDNRTVMIDKKKEKSNASLINLAAIMSDKQGAKVYIVYPEEMPLEGSAMNAILRY